MSRPSARYERDTPTAVVLPFPTPPKHSGYDDDFFDDDDDDEADLELSDVCAWLRREESLLSLCDQGATAAIVEKVRTRLERHEHRR